MNRGLGRLLSHPLTRNSAFMHLWAGQTAAEFGFQVATLATSAIAISLLHATESEIGVLAGLQTLAFLLIGLPAGAWVDRWRKRRAEARRSWPMRGCIHHRQPWKAPGTRSTELLDRRRTYCPTCP